MVTVMSRDNLDRNFRHHHQQSRHAIISDSQKSPDDEEHVSQHSGRQLWRSNRRLPRRRQGNNNNDNDDDEAVRDSNRTIDDSREQLLPPRRRRRHRTRQHRNRILHRWYHVIFGKLGNRNVRVSSDKGRAVHRWAWKAALVTSFVQSAVCFFNSVYLHVAVRQSIDVFTDAVDYTDRAALFGVVTALMDCSSVLAAWEMLLCVVVVFRHRRGEHCLRPIHVAGTFHSIMTILTAVVMLLTAMLLANHLASVWKSKNALSLGINYYGQADFIKLAFDAMHQSLECCGSSGFEDWFVLPWTDSVDLLRGHVIGFPKSCCNGELARCENMAPSASQLPRDMYKRGCSARLASAYGSQVLVQTILLTIVAVFHLLFAILWIRSIHAFDVLCDDDHLQLTVPPHAVGATRGYRSKSSILGTQGQGQGYAITKRQSKGDVRRIKRLRFRLQPEHDEQHLLHEGARGDVDKSQSKRASPSTSMTTAGSTTVSDLVVGSQLGALARAEWSLSDPFISETRQTVSKGQKQLSAAFSTNLMKKRSHPSVGSVEMDYQVEPSEDSLPPETDYYEFKRKLRRQPTDCLQRLRSEVLLEELKEIDREILRRVPNRNLLTRQLETESDSSTISEDDDAGHALEMFEFRRELRRLLRQMPKSLLYRMMRYDVERRLEIVDDELRRRSRSRR